MSLLERAKRDRFERFPGSGLRSFALFCGVAISVHAAGVAASYSDVKPVLDQAGEEQLPADLRNPTEARWTAWNQREDKAIRARLRQGDLDSMVNLLLYGTSFTKQPRVRIESLSEASRSGMLRARVDDLVAALRNPAGNERLNFLNELVRGAGIDPGDPGPTGVFIYNNLQRVMQEMATLAKRGEEGRHLTQANGAPDSAAIFKWRSGLLRDRGVSLDTGVLPDYSIEQALRDLKNRGVLREGQIARVAVVGPGLDFSDKNEAFSYDYYPQQTTQPFALYDSLLRLRLASANGMSMTIFDISARVIGHIQRARTAASMKIGYTIQIPREVGNAWPADLVRYWRSLGDQVGEEVMPIRPPEIFQSANGGRGLEARAVKVRPDIVLRCQPVDLNIVLEQINMAETERFDLMVGTNIFIYYDAFERSLALENAGAMLKRGGLLLTNDWLPEVRGRAMRQVGLTAAPDSQDAVGWYQKR